MSVFDILGPAMIGPSSSHTAGALNIGRMARQVFGKLPEEATITLYGSFAATYKGHGTDRALVAGILGFSTADSRVKNSLEIAQKRGLKVNFSVSSEESYHPNTVRIELKNKKDVCEIVGVSIGGGRVKLKEVNNFKVDISGKYNTLLCSYKDQVGIVSSITQILANEKINIAFMSVSRDYFNGTALMVAEVDEDISPKVVKNIQAMSKFYIVKVIKKLEF